MIVGTKDDVALAAGPCCKDDPMSCPKSHPSLDRVDRKPDGWHTYHVCDGHLREIVRAVPKDGGQPELLCVHCGQWAWVSVTDEAVITRAKEIESHA